MSEEPTDSLYHWQSQATSLLRAIITLAGVLISILLFLFRDILANEQIEIASLQDDLITVLSSQTPLGFGTSTAIIFFLIGGGWLALGGGLWHVFLRAPRYLIDVIYPRKSTYIGYFEERKITKSREVQEFDTEELLEIEKIWQNALRTLQRGLGLLVLSSVMLSPLLISQSPIWISISGAISFLLISGYYIRNIRRISIKLAPIFFSPTHWYDLGYVISFVLFSILSVLTADADILYPFQNQFDLFVYPIALILVVLFYAMIRIEIKNETQETVARGLRNGAILVFFIIVFTIIFFVTVDVRRMLSLLMQIVGLSAVVTSFMAFIVSMLGLIPFFSAMFSEAISGLLGRG